MARISKPLTLQELILCPISRAMAKATIARNTEEVGDCLVWTARMVGTSPVAYFGGSVMTVRRVVLALQGKQLTRGLVAVDTCRTAGCVNPEHLRLWTRKAMIGRAGSEGRLSLPDKCATITKVRRLTAPKLTLQDARAIRASQDPAKVLALRYGVNQSLIRRIKRGEVWAETVACSSVWALAA